MRIINTLTLGKRGVLFVLLMGLSFFSNAQDGYKVVDSTTYSYYQKSQWKELVTYGNVHQLDYYYFNLRMGIAYYALNQFFSAEEYFKKAIDNNETEYAMQYLYWTYMQLGEQNVAENIYYQLSDTAKKTMDRTPKFLEGVYIEAGVKIPNEKEVGTLFYGSLVLYHNLAKNLKLTHSFTPFSQLVTSHENITNFQYNAFLSYQLNNTNIGIGGMFASTNLSAKYQYDTYREDQEIRTKTNSFYLNVSHRINRLRLNLNINYAPQNIDYIYTYTDNNGGGGGRPGNPTVYDSNSLRNAFIPSVGFMYFPRVFKDRFGLGADGFMVNTDQDLKFVFKPYISVLFSDRLWLNASYFEINHQLFSDYSTNIFYNINQETKRFSATFSYLVTPKIVLNATYLNEAIHDNLVDNYYTLNSIFIGAKFNLF